VRNWRIILNWMLVVYVVRKEVTGTDDVHVYCRTSMLKVLNVGSATDV